MNIEYSFLLSKNDIQSCTERKCMNIDLQNNINFNEYIIY